MNSLDIYLTHVKMNGMDDKNLRLKGYSQSSASFQRHRRQRFWQILAPTLLGGLLVLAVAVLMVLSISGIQTGINVSQGADISLIWIIMPILLIAVFLTIILLAMIYGMSRILGILPVYSRMAQDYVTLVAARIQHGAKKVTAPIVSVKTTRSAMKAFFSALIGRKGK